MAHAINAIALRDDAMRAAADCKTHADVDARVCVCIGPVIDGGPLVMLRATLS